MEKCGAKCEVYSRVTGYFRPVANWNRGKQQEFKDRKPFKVAGAVVALLACFLVSGCGHNTISYGDGIMLETTINPETYAFGVSLRYGKILTACVRENTTVEMTGGNNATGGGTDKGNTAAKTEASVKVAVGRQITGYYCDAVKAGAKPEDLQKYADTGEVKLPGANTPAAAEAAPAATESAKTGTENAGGAK